MTRLLILAYELPPIGGGTAQSLHQLLMAWKDDGEWEIEVWTAVPPMPTPRVYPGFIRIREFSCLKKSLHFWRLHELGILLWQAWRKSLDDSPRPDALLVWGALPLSPLLLGSLGESPSVLALRGSDVPGFNPRTSGGFWKGLARMIWRRASCVTVNSPMLASLARKTDRRMEFEVIPNGVSAPLPEGLLESRSPDSSSAMLERRCQQIAESAQLGFSEERPFRILAASRLIPRKRVDWMISAVSMLPHEIRRKMRLRIAGDGPERFRMEAMVEELALSPCVQLLGAQDRQQMTELYLSSDLFAQTSMAEGMSNSLLEAMASGLPALAAEPTGFPDLDEAIAAVQSAEELAVQMQNFMESAELRLKFTGLSLAAASHYTWERAAEKYKLVLKRIARHD